MKSTHCLCFTVLAFATGACVNRVPIEGLSCPCLDGYTCCDTTNQCLPSASYPQTCPPADAAGTTGGTTGGATGGATGGTSGVLPEVWPDAGQSRWQPIASWSSADWTVLPSGPVLMGDRVTFSDDYNSGRALTYRFAQNDWLLQQKGYWPGRGFVFGAGLVWTGSQVVYWGGVVQVSTCNSLGGLYSPATDTWSAINTTGAPLLAVDSGGYTGKEVVLRGDSCVPKLVGMADRGPVIGALYNPATDTWRNMSSVNAPTAENGTNVVLGERMVCWGGAPYDGAPGYTPTSGWTNSGAVYNAADDTWTAMSTTNAPSPRSGMLALAMRGRMFVWGGTDGGTNSLGEQNYFHDGGIFDPETNTWMSISKEASPNLTADNGFWAEEQGLVYVWVSIETSGVASRGVALWTYDPSADRWASVDVTGLPEMLSTYFVWTGRDLLAIGELTSIPTNNMDVLRYTP